jgi:hypothetical protein
MGSGTKLANTSVAASQQQNPTKGIKPVVLGSGTMLLAVYLLLHFSSNILSCNPLSLKTTNQRGSEVGFVSKSSPIILTVIWASSSLAFGLGALNMLSRLH